MKNKRIEKAKKKRHALKKEQRSEFKRFMDSLSPEEIIAATAEHDTISWLFVLHEKRGYGKKRLEETLKQRNEIVDAINKGYLDYFDMAKVLIDEVGMDL